MIDVDRHPRVERAQRVLQHDLRLAPEPAQPPRPARRDRRPAEPDLARASPGRGRAGCARASTCRIPTRRRCRGCRPRLDRQVDAASARRSPRGPNSDVRGSRNVRWMPSATSSGPSRRHLVDRRSTGRCVVPRRPAGGGEQLGACTRGAVAAPASSAVPCSTMRPSRITITIVGDRRHEGDVVADEHQRRAVLGDSCRSSASTSACTVTSRAVVGSSAISSAGLHARAMAMPTRWRCPPDSWCG